MGAILDAAKEKYGQDVAVSDPFSGGGTVTFEAVQRGIKTYAQDLHAWPSRGLGVAIRYCDPEKLKRAAQQLLKAVAPVRKLYVTEYGTELSHVLRVRGADCVDCGKRNFLFPAALLSLESRSGDNRQAFFGCCACGAVSRRLRTTKSFSCGQCGKRAVTARTPVGCAHCGGANLKRASYWHAVLVQELVNQNGRLRSRLRPVRQGDPVAVVSARDEHSALAQPIQRGIETRRLLDRGFSFWGDVYTARQAKALIGTICAVKRLRASRVVKDRLALAVLGAAEMPGFLSRWDRFHLKTYEAMANHRFAHSNIAVEANLLSPVGRGTIPKRLEAACKALDWLVEAGPRYPRVLTQSSRKKLRRASSWDVLVTTGSSRSQALPRNSVNVVITDPPYYDDVQYGELARLFHTWLRVYWPRVVVDESDEAVPNAQRGTTAQDYEDTIAACLTESRRTLRRDGRLVLTFHNKKLAAWRALAGALRKSGFVVDALAVVLAENATDHCKRSVEAMLHDLVIECVPVRKKKSRPDVPISFVPKTTAERNLAAMGLALAEVVRRAKVQDLKSLFHRHLAHLRERCPLIR
jgi:16S rRNA G966 N2-methylase RsmD